MPRFVVPKSSGVHRIAGIALFRVLLTQCRALPLAYDEKITLQNIVRNKFKSYKDVQSNTLLSVMFQAGYEAVDLLDSAAAGREESLSKLGQILSQTPAHLKRPPKLAPLAPEYKPRRLPKRPSDTGYSVLNRPRLQVSGVRQVPVLVTANQIPFLRFKKPQPGSFSAYIASRVDQRQRRHDLMDLMETSVPMGLLEDKWDRIIQQESEDARGGPNVPVDSGSWADEYRSTIKDVGQYLRTDQGKIAEMSRKMQDIVVKETELAKAEKQQRKNQKRSEKHRLKSVETAVAGTMAW